MQTNTPGRIITFYSFKGGTGRSMAVANVGHVLASSDFDRRKILLIDWDLEAPGLHRYLWRGFGKQVNRSLESKEYARELNNFPGLLEVFTDYQSLLKQSSLPRDLSDAQIEVGRQQVRETFFRQFDKYVLHSDDGLGLVKAGKFDAQYPSHIQEFDWRAFHQLDPGFFPAFRDFLVEEYDFLLIDSRTGLTDTSGICTQEMPDTLVLVFVPNRQNIDGLRDVLHHVKVYRTGGLRQAPLSVYPLASRIDASSSTLRRLWRQGGFDGEDHIEGYQPTFEQLLKEIYQLDKCDLGHYFDVTQVPHDVSFSFGEKIAVKSGTTEKLSMGAAYANLTKWLTSEAAAWEDVDQFEKTVQPSPSVVDRFRTSLETMFTGLHFDTWWKTLGPLNLRPLPTFRLVTYLACLVVAFIMQRAWQSGPLCNRAFPSFLAGVESLARYKLMLMFPSSRVPKAHFVSLVTFRPGREPDEIFGNVCRKRLYLASVVKELEYARPSAIVIDEWFPPTSCPENDPGTKMLTEVLSASRVPIILGQQTYDQNDPELENNPAMSQQLKANLNEACLILAPTLKLNTEQSNITYGLARLDSAVDRIPLSWRAYPSQVGSQTRPILSLGMALAAAKTINSQIATDARIRDLVDNERHPYTSFLESSQIPSFPASHFLPQAKAEQGVGQTSVRNEQKDYQALAGQAVVIGDEARNDMHSSPIGDVPGVVLQANYLEAILDNRYFVPLPAYFDLFIILFTIFAVERLFVFSFSPLRGLIYGIGFAAVVLLSLNIISVSVGYLSFAWPFIPIVLITRYVSSLKSSLSYRTRIATPAA
jgi:CHASE2 domain-containing sensor protein/cellulose biosynthesis protein BcsQ